LEGEAASLFCAAASPQASGAWFRALAESTLAPEETPVLAVLRGKTCALAAIALVRTATGAFRGLTAPYSSSFGPAALSCEDAYWLGAKLAGVISRRVDLDALDAADPTSVAFLEGLTGSGLVSTSYRHFANWYEEVGSFEAYWAARPTRLRETVRRKERKLRSDGGTFVTLSTPQELEQGIPQYLDVYANSGKVAEPHPAFMPAMMERMAQEGDVRLGLLRMGDQVAAAQLWLVRAGSATIFKLAHRSEFAAYSPGTLLTHWMFSDLLPRQEIKRVDFGRGDDFYKRDWLNYCAFRKGVIACNPANLAGLRDIATEILPAWAGLALRKARAAI
jgi:CelD/BcsL family acetyltransferase involved in cellulose biosynthesis